MSNYKQEIIPETFTDRFKGMDKEEIRKYIKKYYSENFQSKKTVKNKNLGINIKFIRLGRKKHPMVLECMLKKLLLF